MRSLFSLLLVAYCFCSQVRDVKFFEPLEIPQLRHVSKRSESVSLSFMAHSRKFELELVPNTETFHEDIQFEYEANGELFPYSFDTSVYYKGSGKAGEHKCSCSMRIDRESGSMSGIIVSESGENSFGIEPSERFTDSKESPMVIYKWSDIDHGERKCEGIQGEEDVSLVSQVQSSQKRQALDTCTMSLVGDSKLYVQLGRSVLRTTQRLVDVIVGSNTIYRAQSIGGFQIIHTRVYTDPATDPFQTASSAETTFLSAVKTQRPNIPPANKCLVHAMTYSRWNNNVVGLAYVNGVCSVTDGDSVSTLNFQNVESTLSSITLTVAHEIGHNFGASHDANGTYIMAAVSGSNSINQFSQMSIDAFNARRAANGYDCFIARPPTIGFCGNGWVDSGEQCDCKDTCGTNQFCSVNCTLNSGYQCDPESSFCCSPAGQFSASGTACGPVPSPGVPAPTCNGVSTTCPNCFPGEHPSAGFNSLIACNLNRACKAGCATTTNPGTCIACNQFTSSSTGIPLRANLPDGTCCNGGGLCQNGVCVGGQTSQGVSGTEDVKSSGVMLSSCFGLFALLAQMF